MYPVVSTEDGKTTIYTWRFIINLLKSVKVICMSKQIDLIGNTNGQKRPNLHHVVDIDCRSDKNA